MYAQSSNDVKDLLNEHASRVFIITDNNTKEKANSHWNRENMTFCFTPFQLSLNTIMTYMNLRMSRYLSKFYTRY